MRKVAGGGVSRRRRGGKTLQRSQKTVVIGAALAVAFGAVSAFLFPLYGTALGALAMPFLVILTLRTGAFCGGLAVGMLALVALSQLGWLGALFVALIVPGTLAVIVALMTRKAPIHHVTYYGAATVVAGMVVFWAVYALATGSDLATDMVAAMEEAVLALLPAADSVPAETGDAWQTLLRQMLVQARESMKAEILPQMIFLSCLSVLLGATLPTIHMRKHALAESVSNLSHLHTWRIPRRLTLALMLSYLVTMLLAAFGVAGMLVVSQTVWSVIKVVYATGCLSFLALQMRKGAMSRGTRNLLLCLTVLAMLALSLFGFLGSVPYVLLGVIGEMTRMQSARVPGDSNGPFGPPDPPMERREDGPGDDN